MGLITIACYRPKPGKAEGLKELMKTHLLRLRAEGLVTGRESIIMEAADGTIVEVFEWLSHQAIQNAHTNPAVLKMWGEYGEVCDYVNLNSIAESADMFAGFKPVNFDPFL
jgi:mevalonate pyrophosphate decarboxylase